MAGVNNMNDAGDFWANLKKQKEEEARQREQVARESDMSFAMYQDEMDDLPEPEPDDDFIASEVVQEPTGDDEKEIIKFFPIMEAVADKLIKYCYSKQSPLILEPVWKTVGKSPKLADNCLDCFVWSNLSVIHLFTSFSYKQPNRIGRTERTLVWLLKMLLEYSKSGQFNADEIIDKLSFNTKNDKAFSVKPEAYIYRSDRC